MRSYCKGNTQAKSTGVFSSNSETGLSNKSKILQDFKYNFKI